MLTKNRTRRSGARRKPVIGYILFGVVYLLSLLLWKVVEWSRATYGVALNEILYTLATPLKGTDAGVMESAIESCVPPVIWMFVPYLLLVAVDCLTRAEVLVTGTIFKLKTKINIRILLRASCAVLSVVAFVSSFAYADREYALITYINNSLHPTTIYEDYYVDPMSVQITAKDSKQKNLLLIYLESMETTYASNEVGGRQFVSLIPNLTQIAQDNVSFSDGDGLGGFHTIVGTAWTVGALFGTSTGVPFSFPVNENSMNERTSFAGGINALGDVLEAKGYNQEFLCGSDASYGGRSDFYQQHGNYQIFDMYTARSAQYIPEDYYVWWGYEDEFLFEIAKDELVRLSELDEPFNLTMLTVDTHFPGGYVCDLCDPALTEDPARAAISCSDRQVFEFLEWCKQQEFYEDTTIVLMGDHPRMDTQLVEGVDYFDRTMYNCFINADADTTQLNEQNRVFTTLDMFPTIISAMGFEIEGNQLGLGVDLFSGRQTLVEELGFDYLTEELQKTSNYYLKNFS